MKLDIMGLQFDNVTMDEASARAEQILAGKKTCYAVTPNAEIAYEALYDETLRALINGADLVLPDGAGVVLASKLLKTPLKQKVAGVDFADRLLSILEKTGGGLFLLVYLVLVLTFGFTLLSSDIAIGRRTHKSAIGAYAELHPKWKFLGILTFLVPVLIMTYYAVIGGWITKYAVVYLTGQAQAAAQDSYFIDFITSPVSPVVFALVFMAVTALIVYNGVESGIEKVSRFMMPFIAMLSTILIGWIKTPDYVIGEMERNGEHFRRKSVYRVMIRYIAPVIMLILFLQSTGILS